MINHIKNYRFIGVLFFLVLMLLGLATIASAKDYHKNRYHNKEYSSALKTLWTKVHPSSGKTLYCDKPFSTKNYRERKKHVNAEHVYPVSWIAKSKRCGTRKACQKNSRAFRQIMSDLHNIYPARIDINKARGNFVFGEVSGEKRIFGKCDFEVNPKSRIAEPANSSKGRIARALLYMSYQYKLPLNKRLLKKALFWDKKYPPTKAEINRQKVIKRYQGKTNPFIANYPFKP